MIQTSGVVPSQVTWLRWGLWAKFTPEVEPAFSRFYNAQLLRSGRRGALAAALVLLSFTAFDFAIVPAAIRPTFFWVRFSFAIAPLLLLAWVSFQPWGQHNFQLLGGLAAVSVGLTVIALICIARRNGTPIAYERVIIVLFFFYSFGGLRLMVAAIAGAIVTLIYPFAEYYSGLPVNEVMVRVPFIVIANIIGLLSSLIMENSARINFALVVELHDKANRDFLTGLFNRRALREKLDIIWPHAVRERQVVTLAMVDVDFFKTYNDDYGHIEGDKVLRRVAEVLQAHTQRPLDVTARFGGEEFVCVWTGNDPESMQSVMDRIQRDMDALNIAHPQSSFGKVSLSLGVIQVQPHLGTDVKTALREADTLLYQAKTCGRNRVAFAVNGTNDTSLKRPEVPVD